GGVTQEGIEIEPNPAFKNLVVVANGFSEDVRNQLAVNFEKASFKVVPLVAPPAPFVGAQSQILQDIAAFTGAKVFGLKNPLSQMDPYNDLGRNMDKFEMKRFRTAIVGQPDDLNIEVRAESLTAQIEN